MPSSAAHCGDRALGQPEPDNFRISLAGAMTITVFYARDHEAYPDKVLLGGEVTNAPPGIPPHDVRVPWFGTRDYATNQYRDYVAGQFIWAGIDYLGETRWPTKGRPAYLLDTCGFRRLWSFYTQSLYSDEPMVSLAVRLPDPAPATGEFTPPAALAAHWNWPRDCRALAVYTFSNAATVELLLNGRSLGVKRPAEAPDRIIIWDDVPNEPGTLKAVARGEGRIVVMDELKMAGKAVRLVLAQDHSSLLANGEDLSNIEVRAVDAGGLTALDNRSRVSFQSEGPAVIAAIDNGDLSTAEAYQGISQCELRNGRALVIIRSQRQPGLITLTARSEGLQDATISLEAQPAPEVPPMLP